MKDELQMWTIFNSPADRPGCIFARRFVAADGKSLPTADVISGETVEAIRAKLPPGLICFPRSPDDPISVVETWL